MSRRRFILVSFPTVAVIGVRPQQVAMLTLAMDPIP